MAVSAVCGSTERASRRWTWSLSLRMRWSIFEGDRLLPGLINAHDHLQLNSLPDHETPKFYQHARDWIAEVDGRRRTDPQFEAGVFVARDERLLLGGLKNLLERRHHGRPSRSSVPLADDRPAIRFP